MADHVLERRFWLPRPRADVFEFFAAPANIGLVQPPGTDLRWIAPPPPSLEVGSVLDFRVRILGLPVRWRVIVREFDRPYRFVDVQLWGPFARWEHRHRFAEGDEDGVTGTWVEDRVTYRLPLGPLGAVAHALFAGRQVTAMFEYRENRLRELLGSRSRTAG